jgi:hypothetical protein
MGLSKPTHVSPVVKATTHQTSMIIQVIHRLLCTNSTRGCGPLYTHGRCF